MQSNPTEIDFSFYPKKDLILANWLVRIEKEMDDYIAYNGSCSPALADKFADIVYEIITNWNNPDLVRRFDDFLRYKLKREPTIGDLHNVAQYVKYKLMGKITDKPELTEHIQKLLAK